MSYQYKRADVQVVVCDICDDFSWIGDRHWRAMPQSNAACPIHLCPKCQRAAKWCPAHQQYHLADTFHRRACIDCGGLFTSIVRDAITRCPACRRAAGDGPTSNPLPAQERPRSFIRQLFSLRTTHRS
jgi:uncharacterized protein YlaI